MFKRMIGGSDDKQAADKAKGPQPPAKGAPAGARKASAPSLISADLRISGDLVSSGDIHVEGAVEGDIRSATLTIGEGAEVRGAIQCETVRVCGAVVGQIQAHRVELTRTAKVTGDILHELLSIESGAFIEGNCRRIEAPSPARDGVVSLADAVNNPAKKGGAA